jgi:hypothetical protein
MYDKISLKDMFAKYDGGRVTTSHDSNKNTMNHLRLGFLPRSSSLT